MEIIFHGIEGVLPILNKIKRTGESSRLLRFCVCVPVEENTLLYNGLTKEMVLLTPEEYNALGENQYLKDHWFLVPEEANDKEYVDFVRWVWKSQQKKTKHINGYTIFPTTDCNARCFYCFELGRSRIPMARETAVKTAQYIKEHSGGQRVKLSWFGGEPLYNREAIETICGLLRETNVDFTSFAVSNGYLFDKETAETAAKDWNLKRVQITLDGTEETYNKVKAYIYKGVNPYQTVLRNIGYLLDAGISVSIRLNMDLYNAEDLTELVEQLGERFAGQKGLHVYAHHIFSKDKPMADFRTDAEWKERAEAMIRLEEAILRSGFVKKSGLSKTIKLNHCMADCGHAVTILPDGSIGLCEHFSEDEFVGHIEREGFDEAVVKSWKECHPDLPECSDCSYYMDCVPLKKCPNSGKCFPALREERIRKLKRSMLNEYEKWKTQQASEDMEEDELC